MHYDIYFILFWCILFHLVLVYSILFWSVLYCSILCLSVLFYSITLRSGLFYSILYWSIKFYSILSYSIQTAAARLLLRGLLTTSPQWCFIADRSIEAVILHQGGLSNVYSLGFFQQGQQVNLSKKGSVVYNCIETTAVSVAMMQKPRCRDFFIDRHTLLRGLRVSVTLCPSVSNELQNLVRDRFFAEMR